MILSRGRVEDVPATAIQVRLKPLMSSRPSTGLPPNWKTYAKFSMTVAVNTRDGEGSRKTSTVFGLVRQIFLLSLHRTLLTVQEDVHAEEIPSNEERISPSLTAAIRLKIIR